MWFRKSDAEITMIRRAVHYAERAIARLLSAAYHGSLAIEGFVKTSKITLTHKCHGRRL